MAEKLAEFNKEILEMHSPNNMQVYGPNNVETTEEEQLEINKAFN